MKGRGASKLVRGFVVGNFIVTLTIGIDEFRSVGVNGFRTAIGE
jgi:hypothetical protein